MVAKIVCFFSVQFRGEAVGSEGKLDEAAAGRHDDENGRARQGIHAEQATGEDLIDFRRIDGFYFAATSAQHVLFTLPMVFKTNCIIVLEGGGPAQLVGAEIRAPQRRPPRGDHRLRAPFRGLREGRLRPRRGQEVPHPGRQRRNQVCPRDLNSRHH